MDEPRNPSRGGGVRFPLYLKILVWFFLNALSLLLIVYLLLGIPMARGLRGGDHAAGEE